jgi:hypothetical protein
MAKHAVYNAHVAELWDEWIAGTGQDSGDPSDFVDWAVANKRLGLRPQDVKQLMRRQVTQALRQSKRFDEKGRFTYRAKQSVTLFGEDGTPTKHYFDTDTGGTQTLRQKSVKERRESIADDVYRAHCDVEHMNSVFPDEPELNLFPDFTDDILELRAAEQAELDKGDDKKGAA